MKYMLGGCVIWRKGEKPAVEKVLETGLLKTIKSLSLLLD